MERMPDTLTIEQAGEFLQLSKDAIYKMAKKGEIPGMKIRGKWRFSRLALKQFVHESSVKNFTQLPQEEPLKKAVGSSLYTVK